MQQTWLPGRETKVPRKESKTLVGNQRAQEKVNFGASTKDHGGSQCFGGRM